jgi:monofunctional biosynthetic peptidoglycan transglycosylase
MEKTVVDFSDPQAMGRWESVNDVVMGGVSRSRLVATAEGTAVFEGEVSFENQGGFASVRTVPGRYPLEGYEGVALRVRGDGKRYRLRLRTGEGPEGMAYQAGFETRPGEWIVPRLSFSGFVPVFRGRVVTGASPLEPARVRGVGLMVADGQEGPFRLEIAWVKAYRQ